MSKKLELFGTVLFDGIRRIETQNRVRIKEIEIRARHSDNLAFIRAESNNRYKI